MRLAILALTVLTLSGGAYAQDDNGGGDNDAAPPDAASVEAPADEAVPEDVTCLLGGVTAAGAPCTAAPVAGASDDDPFANISWEGTTYDSASTSSAPASGGEPVAVGPIR